MTAATRKRETTMLAPGRTYRVAVEADDDRGGDQQERLGRLSIE